MSKNGGTQRVNDRYLPYSRMDIFSCLALFLRATTAVSIDIDSRKIEPAKTLYP